MANTNVAADAPIPSSDEEPAEPTRRDLVASLAARIAVLPTGDKAQLRRMDASNPARTGGLITGLLMAAGMDRVGSIQDDEFRRWAILAHCAALLTGTSTNGAHAPGWQNGLGRKLRDAGYSEARLMRLTSANGPALEAQVIRAARFLAQKSALPVDLRTMRQLLDPDRAETARLSIARGFYANATSQTSSAQ